jgi:hypothetical protein
MVIQIGFKKKKSSNIDRFRQFHGCQVSVPTGNNLGALIHQVCQTPETNVQYVALEIYPTVMLDTFSYQKTNVS